MQNIKAQIIFSGCGGLYNYILGIAYIIQIFFDLTDVIFICSSAGCFPGLLLALDMDILEYFEKMNIPLLKEVNSHFFGAVGVWNDIVRRNIKKHLPKNAYILLKERLYCSMTRVSLKKHLFKNYIITNWKNNSDLIDGIMASSFIQIFDKFKLFSTFRNKSYIDGSTINSIPIINKFESIPKLIISYDMWRFKKDYIPLLWCWTDEKYIRELFILGIKDAIANIDDIANILAFKK